MMWCPHSRVSVSLLVVLMVLHITTAALMEDYEQDDVYQWPPRGIRASPSMRLRFGKRGTGVWGLTQRSMPSLRMRFGKRTPFQTDDGGDLDSYSDRLQRRANEDRTPALRMRFGKRDAYEEQQEPVPKQ